MKNKNKIRRAHGYLSFNGNFTIRDKDNNRYCLNGVGKDWVKGFFRIHKEGNEVLIKQPFDVKYREPLFMLGLIVAIILLIILGYLFEVDTSTKQLVQYKIAAIKL